MFFFSGHGHSDENLKNSYFVPQNGRVIDAYNDTYLSHLELRRQLTSIPCRHILYIVDACFSGTVDDNLALKGGRGNTRAGTGDPGPSPQALIRDRLTHQSRYFLTSGGKERTADGAAPLLSSVFRRDDGYGADFVRVRMLNGTKHKSLAMDELNLSFEMSLKSEANYSKTKHYWLAVSDQL